MLPTRIRARDVPARVCQHVRRGGLLLLLWLVTTGGGGGLIGAVFAREYLFELVFREARGGHVIGALGVLEVLELLVTHVDEPLERALDDHGLLLLFHVAAYFLQSLLRRLRLAPLRVGARGGTRRLADDRHCLAHSARGALCRAPGRLGRALGRRLRPLGGALCHRLPLLQGIRAVVGVLRLCLFGGGLVADEDLALERLGRQQRLSLVGAQVAVGVWRHEERLAQLLRQDVGHRLLQRRIFAVVLKRDDHRVRAGHEGIGTHGGHALAEGA